MQSLEDHLKLVKQCALCASAMAVEPRPVLTAHKDSRAIIIGQAPGTKVFNSGIPWNDKSGENLRNWMGIDESQFYHTPTFAIIPMGFCYPGKGKSGDLPPRKECAPAWHKSLLDLMPKVELVLLIGKYAQDYYLDNSRKRNLTETVKHFEEYLPNYFVLPHPSPRNYLWQARNPWFQEKVVPRLQQEIQLLLPV